MKNKNHINFKQNKPAFTLGGKDGLQLKKAAFTLAEVLIVLGIIGVVAAFTIPTLMNKVQNQEYVVGVKKEYSMINNGFAQLLADEGVDSLDDTSVFQSMETDTCFIYNFDNSACKAF